MEDIQRVGIIGCGVMGAGIAELCARRNLDVVVQVRTQASIERGSDQLRRSLEQGVRREKITAQECAAALERVSFSTDVAALADRDLVIESVREQEDTKLAIFEALDAVIERPDVILASNTSSIPIMKLGRATGRAHSVVGVHFFNPATSLPLVELVETLVTDTQVALRVERFLTDVLGKQVVRSRDRPGFLVNALLIPYLLSAARMAESRFAPAPDIDRAMMLGCAHPIGPLALLDLIGLDTIVDIADALHREFKDPQYAVPPLLSRMVEAGMLGKKSGRGFHHYPN